MHLRACIVFLLAVGFYFQAIWNTLTIFSVIGGSDPSKIMGFSIWDGLIAPIIAIFLIGKLRDQFPILESLLNLSLIFFYGSLVAGLSLNQFFGNSTGGNLLGLGLGVGSIVATRFIMGYYLNNNQIEEPTEAETTKKPLQS